MLHFREVNTAGFNSILHKVSNTDNEKGLALVQLYSKAFCFTKILSHIFNKVQVNE